MELEKLARGKSFKICDIDGTLEDALSVAVGWIGEKEGIPL